MSDRGVACTISEYITRFAGQHTRLVVIQSGFSRSEGARIALFAAVYTVFGLLIPIQGYLTVPFAVGTVFVGVLYGFALAYLNRGIPLRRIERILITLLAVYVIQMLNPVLEGAFFTTQFQGHPELLFGAVVFGVVLMLPMAVAAGLLFGPSGGIKGFRELVKEHLSATGATMFIVRFAIASVLWMVIYFVFGSIVGGLVAPYYTGDGGGYELVIPPLEILLLLQTFRGFIYVLGILPIVMTFRPDRPRLAAVLAALLYVGGALAIFVISDQFVVFLRIVHGVELFADSVVAGLMIAYLLGTRRAVQGSTT